MAIPVTIQIVEIIMPMTKHSVRTYKLVAGCTRSDKEFPRGTANGRLKARSYGMLYSSAPWLPWLRWQTCISDVSGYAMAPSVNSRDEIDQHGPVIGDAAARGEDVAPR